MTIQKMIEILEMVGGVIPSRQAIAIADVVDGLRDLACSLEEMRRVITENDERRTL